MQTVKTLSELKSVSLLHAVRKPFGEKKVHIPLLAQGGRFWSGIERQYLLPEFHHLRLPHIIVQAFGSQGEHLALDIGRLLAGVDNAAHLPGMGEYLIVHVSHSSALKHIVFQVA